MINTIIINGRTYLIDCYAINGQPMAPWSDVDRRPTERILPKQSSPSEPHRTTTPLLPKQQW
jgi:hypothetical protein